MGSFGFLQFLACYLVDFLNFVMCVFAFKLKKDMILKLPIFFNLIFVNHLPDFEKEISSSVEFLGASS